jgi:hypothetical protein
MIETYRVRRVEADRITTLGTIEAIHPKSAIWHYAPHAEVAGWTLRWETDGMAALVDPEDENHYYTAEVIGSPAV